MKSILRTIHDYLYPPRRTGLALNLTAVQLVDLKTLQSQEEWQTYLHLLDSAINLYAEQLLAANEDAEVHRLRGLILGLRKAGTLVTEIIRQQDYEDGQRTKLDTGAGEKSAERTSDLYGTRYGRGV